MKTQIAWVVAAAGLLAVPAAGAWPIQYPSDDVFRALPGEIGRHDAFDMTGGAEVSDPGPLYRLTGPTTNFQPLNAPIEVPEPATLSLLGLGLLGLGVTGRRRRRKTR